MLLGIGLAVAGMGGLGCGEDNAAAPDSAEVGTGERTMDFQVNESLLGPPRTLEDFGIVIRPPAGWAGLPQEQVDLVANALAQEATPTTAPTTAPTQTLDVRPLAVYRSGADGATMLVSAVALSEAELPDYVAAMREQFGNVMTDEFTVNGLPVRQYLIQPGEQVNFKLLIQPPASPPGSVAAGESGQERWLQLDYISSKQDWLGHARAVGSSIGSLRRATAGTGANGP